MTLLKVGMIATKVEYASMLRKQTTTTLFGRIVDRLPRSVELDRRKADSTEIAMKRRERGVWRRVCRMRGIVLLVETMLDICRRGWYLSGREGAMQKLLTS